MVERNGPLASSPLVIEWIGLVGGVGKGASGRTLVGLHCLPQAWQRVSACVSEVHTLARLYNAFLVFFRTSEVLQRLLEKCSAATFVPPSSDTNCFAPQVESTCISGMPSECLTVWRVGIVLQNAPPQPRGEKLPRPRGMLEMSALGSSSLLRSTVVQRKGPRTSFASCGEATTLIRPFPWVLVPKAMPFVQVSILFALVLVTRVVRPRTRPEVQLWVQWPMTLRARCRNTWPMEAATCAFGVLVVNCLSRRGVLLGRGMGVLGSGLRSDSLHLALLSTFSLPKVARSPLCPVPSCVWPCLGRTRVGEPGRMVSAVSLVYERLVVSCLKQC